MNKILIAGLILLIVSCRRHKGPYITFEQPNYCQANGVIYSRYLVSDGRTIVDTSNKYRNGEIYPDSGR